MKNSFIYFITIVACSICSCKHFVSHDKLGALVILGEHKLYKSDVISSIPSGIASKDSIYLFKKYVDDWIINRILIDKAKLNLENQEELEKKVQDYKEKLFIEAYNQRILDKFSDKFVATEKEVKDYYDTYKNTLKLKEDVINLRFFVSRHKLSKSKSKIKKMMVAEEEKDIDNLKDYCKEYSAYYHVNDSVWLELEKLRETLNLDTKNIKKKSLVYIKIL